MQCCGSKPVENGDTLLQKLREDKPNVSTKINECKIDYDTQRCRWKSNINNIYILIL